MNVKEVRRKNLRALARSLGGMTALANKLDRTQSQVSHSIGLKPTKNVGDKLATHIEVCFDLPPGWLDREHAEINTHPSPTQPLKLPVTLEQKLAYITELLVEKGKQESMQTVATRLLRRGHKVLFVTEVTGLKTEEVERLKRK